MKIKPYFSRRRAQAAAPALVLLAALSAFGAGATKKEESKYYPLTIFSRVLAHIQSVYVEDVEMDRLIYGAIKGMVSSLDPHSSYLTPEEYKTIQEEMKGKFGGVGIEVEYRFGRLIVISPLPGTPAEKAGMRSGDEILAIDDVPTYTLTIQDAVRAMRGKPGDPVKIKLRRGENKVFELDIVREVINVESVEGRVVSEEEKTALLAIKVFQEGTAEKFRDLLDSFEARCKGSLRGVVVDLRNNPGGLLDQAIYVADEFLEKGVILTTRRRGGEVIETEKAHRVGTRSNIEIVLLVNEYTASAAEVLAGALQDNGRARVLGTRTFGKGSIQNIIKLPDGSALKLTTALYSTPSGRIIQAEGIEPELVVPQVSWDPSSLSSGTFSEKELTGHIEGGWQKSEGTKAPAADTFGGDYQLFMAYQYMRARLMEKNEGSPGR